MNFINGYKRSAILFILMIFLSVCFWGCGSTPQNLVRDRAVTVTTPGIHDTLYGKVDTNTNILGLADTNNIIELPWTAYRITDKGDTSAKATVYPKLRKIALDTKPLAQIITIRDTVPVPKPAIKEIIKPYPILSKIGLIGIGAGTGVMLAILGRMYFKKPFV
jgi:hypothetical protein